MTTVYNENVTGVILAGGKARRMGGCDKGLVEINNKTMVGYVVDALQPQVKTILINANRNTEAYGQLGYEVITDQLEDYQGPLAGMAAAMAHAKTEYIFTCPCDGPLLSRDLVAQLASSLQNEDAEIAVAHDGKRLQPVYALINCKLHSNLLEYLHSGERKIDHWYSQHRYKKVDLSGDPDCFININTPEDQAQISAKLKY